MATGPRSHFRAEITFFKLQIPNSHALGKAQIATLKFKRIQIEFGYWSFPRIWLLVIGIYEVILARETGII